jgi:site-specific DNA-methyltransferase (adenine-specific)
MIHLHNTDNLLFMKDIPNNYFDIAIVDPQTGQDEGKKHLSRPKSVMQDNGKTLNIKSSHRVKEWDNKQPPQEYFNELFRVSKHQIIMCENYLHFTQKDNSPGRIVWNLLRENDFSDCQVMWTSLFQKIEYFEYMWNGMMQGTGINSRTQQGNKALNQKRIHPSEKPIPVYKYLFKTYVKPGWKVFDSHLGSGASAIAAYEMEVAEFHGCEIDEDIFNDAEKRYKGVISQQRLFQAAS